ncbi:hypothetical protein GHT06_006282 [Daphnia sinensis]|uniref:Uncharacterized protein n=1 Tax=Daphnia sinensis TaxID=1820382 RepID=A0AAD5PLE2_9CRUS|nr:hypothetical protein GHT06_006282 [Daphnia sinensis]
MESITVPARTCLRTSPTLVGDHYDAMRSNCSLSNLRVVWPGSQRVNLVKCKYMYVYIYVCISCKLVVELWDGGGSIKQFLHLTSFVVFHFSHYDKYQEH